MAVEVIQQFTDRDLRGITAHKVYPINALLQKPVSSYLTFSPLLLSCHAEHVEACQERSGNFLRHFLLFVTSGKLKETNSRLLTGVLLFAVRTFLPPINWRTITRLIEDKGRFNLLRKKLLKIDSTILDKLHWRYQQYKNANGLYLIVDFLKSER